MSDRRFSFLVSLLFLLPLLANPGVLILLPVIILYPSSIDNTFFSYMLILFLFFVISFILMLTTLKLARNKQQIANYLVYIFALPLVSLICIFILAIFNTGLGILRTGTSDGGEGLLGVLIGVIYYMMGFSVSGFYFFLIKKRIKEHLGLK